MSVTPEQLRSIDPFQENRFSDNLNIRTRMLTNGRDVFVHDESFELSYNGTDNIFTVGPGIFIKDDVMVHITEETVIDLTGSDGFMHSEQPEPPITSGVTPNYDLYLFINYRYRRQSPPPKASYVLMKHNGGNYNVLDYYSEQYHLWIGTLKFLDVSTPTIITNEITINLLGDTFKSIYIDPTPTCEIPDYEDHYNCGLVNESDNWILNPNSTLS